MYSFLTHTRTHTQLTHIEQLTLLIAAAIHDYQHPGVSNAYLIHSHSALALRYNDRNVLESMHVACAFRYMHTHTHCNILQHLTHEQYTRTRKLIVELVLSTDLADHFDLLGLLKRKQESMDMSVEEDRKLYMRMALKW